MKKGTGFGGSWLQVAGITANVPLGTPDASNTVKPGLWRGRRKTIQLST